MPPGACCRTLCPGHGHWCSSPGAAAQLSCDCHMMPPGVPCHTLHHGCGLLRIQVSVQILIPLIFYSSQFILLIFIHACICSQPVFVVLVKVLQDASDVNP